MEHSHNEGRAVFSTCRRGRKVQLLSSEEGADGRMGGEGHDAR